MTQGKVLIIYYLFIDAYYMYLNYEIIKEIICNQSDLVGWFLDFSWL